MTVFDFAVWRPVSSHGGAMSNHLGLVLHVQQGNGSPYAMFSDPSQQKSSTWWVSKTGVLEQYVDSGLKAWAQKNGNATYNSVETEGKVGEPLTDAQIETLARLYAAGHTEYGWALQLANRPGERGLGTHVMGGTSWGGHPCPGPIRIGQRQEILDRAAQILSEQQPSAQPAIAHQEDDDMRPLTALSRFTPAPARWVFRPDTLELRALDGAQYYGNLFDLDAKDRPDSVFGFEAMTDRDGYMILGWKDGNPDWYGAFDAEWWAAHQANK